jgi:hypothetical protein
MSTSSANLNVSLLINRVQCGGAALFVLLSAFFILTNLLSGISLDSVYFLALLASIVNNGLAIFKSIKVLSALLYILFFTFSRQNFGLDANTFSSIMASPNLPNLIVSLFLWVVKHEKFKSKNPRSIRERESPLRPLSLSLAPLILFIFLNFLIFSTINSNDHLFIISNL